MTHDLEQLALVHLRAAREPVREFVLYDRVAAACERPVSADAFVVAMDRLMTDGRVHVIADHEPMGRDPAPFSPRYYRIVE